ncbi:MAG TPA: FHA domain-containing protein [Nannocystaceae bacterium]|nr:FHA domain-containing protein [Nannocystaceae bacterium]
MEHGFDFCPICGQNQRERLARPDTRIIQIEGEQAPADRTVPAPGPPTPLPPDAVMPAVVWQGSQRTDGTIGYGGPDALPPVSPDRTVPAPGRSAPAPYPNDGRSGGTIGAGPMPPPMIQPPPMMSSPSAMPSPDRTVPSPAIVLRRPEVGEDDRTVPAPGRVRTVTSEEDPTYPDARMGAGPAVQPAGDNDPTAAFDSRQVMAAVAAERARKPEDDTREGAVPVGPWSGSSPSQPVVGERGQASLPTNPGTRTARLVLVARDGSEGEKFAVVGDRLTLGRRAADVLFADDDFISPTHARIERSGETFWLVDTGSQNGVYLRIRGTAAIYPGDTFMVGHQLLRVENVEGPADEQPPDELGTRLFGTPLQPAWGKLVLVGRGGIRGDHFGMRGARIVIGRESGDVVFPHDPFLSREHARLRLELNGATMSVFLEDLNSANGTYIRVRGSAELHNRDTFRIGDQIIRLRTD